MFVVDLYLTVSYFVSFVHVYSSDALVRLMSMPVCCCHFFNACQSLHDRLCFGFVISNSMSCDLTSLEGY